MKLELTAVLSVWWSILWRSFLYAFASGCVVGVIFSIIAVLLGHHGNEYLVLRTCLGAVVGFIAGIFALKQALEKHLRALLASANRVLAANEQI